MGDSRWRERGLAESTSLIRHIVIEDGDKASLFAFQSVFHCHFIPTYAAGLSQPLFLYSELDPEFPPELLR